MPIAYILGNLLADVTDAAGVVFLDDAGEAIETASSRLSPDEMREIGALVEIQLRRLQKVLEGDSDARGLLHIEGQRMNLHALRIKDCYLLVLIQRQPAISGLGRRALRQAGRALEHEILT